MEATLRDGRRRRDITSFMPTASRPVEQNPTAPLGHDHQTLRGLAGGGNAVIAAANPAMQALHDIAFLIDARDQAVGARRCPRLLDAERPEATPLHRLVTILAGGQ